MKFLIITNAPTLKKNQEFYSYAPYVCEVDLWSKYITDLGIISPIIYSDKLLLSPFATNPKIFPIEALSFVSIKSSIISFFKIPLIIIRLFKAMQWADHLHLRSPGNIGLLGCMVQIFFPNKPKTVKYAGNWDPKSKQPLSYRLQKWIVSNTFLTKNTKVLVYGEWPNQSKNILPFFTASYSEKEIEEQRVELFSFNNKNKINFIFVGALTKGKQPLLSVKVVHELKNKGYKVQLDMYGEGIERTYIEEYIQQNGLSSFIILHGNVSKNIVKKAYKKAHFLLFISKSEGWPKVVAEAMFWGCLPISSNVSCIPYMLENGNRGAIVNSETNEIVLVIEDYLKDNEKYEEQVKKAMNWSREYTLEKFEKEIERLLNFSCLEGNNL